MIQVFDTLSTLEDLSRLRPTWGLLADSKGRTSPFEDIDWNIIYAQNIPYGDLSGVVGHSSVGTNFILPLSRKNDECFSLCKHKTDYNFFFTENQEILNKALRFLSAQGVKRVFLSSVHRDDMPHFRVFKRAEFQEIKCPNILADEIRDISYEKKLGNEIRRSMHTLNGTGIVEHSVMPVSKDLLLTFIEMNGAWWRRKGFSGLAASDKEKKFFLDVLPMSNHWRMSALFHEKNIISLMLLTIDQKKKMWGYYAGAHALKYRSLSIGKVHLHLFIQYVQENGGYGIDFLRGDEEYKYDFGATDKNYVYNIHLELP